MEDVATSQTHEALADEIRALGELVATHSLSESQARAARAALAGLRAELGARASRVSTVHSEGLPRWPVERSAISGPLNPYAPPLRVDDSDADVVVGTMTYPRALQGPPEHAHGGHVAMVFDHLGGRAATRGGRAVVTGRLAVRYHRPTPVGKPIRFEARIREVRHSLVTVECAAFDGETKTASAEILFFELGPAHFDSLFADAARGKVA